MSAGDVWNTVGGVSRANNDTAGTTWDNLKVESTLREVNLVLSDDFSSNTINPALYAPDAPFFEGGVGDIAATAVDGVIEFAGTVSQQWWAGSTLRIVPTFPVAEDAIYSLFIDRVAEAGVGSASRSALWILNQTRDRYVLFADVRGEGGWRYNRKIGEDGDVPTGGGVNMAAFDGPTFDDGGLHRMGMIADGKTVKLLLDGIEGAEVKFPFSPVIFEFGSYARANGDTANTRWDNLQIETAGAASFDPRSASVRVGQNSGDITVKIPAGLNAQSAVQLRVVSANPTIAEPVGGTGGALTLTFPAGGANTQTFKVRGLVLGGTRFTLEGDITAANELAVAVISGPGVQMEDNFAGANPDPAKWQISNAGFETGTGTFTISTASGSLEINGTTDVEYWAGISLKSVRTFVATPELHLAVEADRVAIDQVGTAGRTGIFLTTSDRSRYVYFGQNLGENGWQVNVNPGSPAGGGTTIAAFSGITDNGNHRLRMVADGETVEVFLDGVSGGKFAFAVTTGIHVELGAYARAVSDTVYGQFDNVKVENVIPCTTVSPSGVSMTLGESGHTLTVRVPALLHDVAPATVTVTSQNPAVAIPAGAVNGVLTLTFAAGGPSSQTVSVVPVGLGSTRFTLASTPANCVAGSVSVEVVAVPVEFLADTFSGTTVDESKWRRDETPFGSGTFQFDASSITVEGGVAKINVTAESATWPGLALYTTQTYTASGTEPTTFEIDRVLLDFVLVTGTGANQRTGIWVREPAGAYVFFSENVAHDGRNFGWRYNLPSETPTDPGVNIAAFDGGTFDNQKNHRMKIVVNGSTAKLYLDGVLGAEVPFAFNQGLSFGFGAYVAAASDVVRSQWDNARILGGAAAVPPELSVNMQGNNVVITWTGDGVLQSKSSLSAAWVDVTPAPTGKSLTIPAASLTGTQFYRLR